MQGTAPAPANPNAIDAAADKTLEVEGLFGRCEIRLSQRQLLVDGEPVSLGARAFDLLAALVARRDRVVSKSELLDLVWPGLVVEENNLAVHVSALRKLLPTGALTTVPGRGYRFTAAWHPPASVAAWPSAGAPTGASADMAAGGSASSATVTGLHTVSAPMFANAALYGREAALADLQALLATRRLVTLVGAGGVGKTALMQALVRALHGHYPGGVHVVDLASLTDAQQLAPTIAGAMHIPLGAGPPASALVARLGTLASAPRCLLVLDNCEHVLQPLAELVSLLLQGAPSLALLATSQEALRLHDEQVYRLGSLDASAALQLFAARAQAADAHFVLNPSDQAAALDICQQLDGVALAIELAAARVPLLGVDGVRSRLHDRLRLLSGGARDTPARHRSVRAALEWSHSLLDGPQQAVFRRLGVMLGSFDISSAQHVAADNELDAWDAVDALSALVDKSLVAVEEVAGGESRYRLLKTMRHFALDLLAASAEQDLPRARHAAFFCELALSQGRSTAALGSKDDCWRLAVDHDNLRAALDWAEQHDAELGLRVAAAMLPFWRERGHHGQAQARCQRLLAHASNQQPSMARARVRIGLCAFANELGQTPQLRGLALAVLQDARALHERGIEALGHIWLAHAECADGQLAGAEAEFRHALVIMRELGDFERVAETLTNVAWIVIERGQADASAPLLDEAQALYAAADHLWGLGFVTATMADAAMALGDLATALRRAEESLAYHRRLQHQHRLSVSLLQRATVLRLLSRASDAQADLLACLDITLACDFAAQTQDVLLQSALLAHSVGWPEGAAQMLGAAQAQAGRAGLLNPAQAGHSLLQAQQHCQALLPVTAWQLAFAAGQALTQREIASLVAASLRR